MDQVSIILPTYNRRRYIAKAFEAMAQQTFSGWELVVIDDGSTDGTRELVSDLTRKMPGVVRYIHQENQGVAAARNRGLEEARCPLIAFFDSDDLWLPHHLEDCVQALYGNADVSWVFGAGRHVDLVTGQVIKEHSFRPNGQALGFLSLRHRTVGKLRIIEDSRALAMTIQGAQFGGLQASVFRRNAFEGRRFPNARIGEDFGFAVHYLADGLKMAYLDDVHVIYQVHDEQTSAAAGQRIALDKRVARQQAYAQVIHDLIDLPGLGQADRQLLRNRYAMEKFWKEGYHLFWQHGQPGPALAAMRQGLMCTPTNASLWRSYLLNWARRLLGRAPHTPSQPPATTAASSS